MSILGRFLAFSTTTVTLLAAGWIRNIYVASTYFDFHIVTENITHVWIVVLTKHKRRWYQLGCGSHRILQMWSFQEWSGHLVAEWDQELPPSLAPQLVTPRCDLPCQRQWARFRSGEVHPLQLDHHLTHHVVPAVPVKGEHHKVQGQNLAERCWCWCWCWCQLMSKNWEQFQIGRGHCWCISELILLSWSAVCQE